MFFYDGGVGTRQGCDLGKVIFHICRSTRMSRCGNVGTSVHSPSVYGQKSVKQLPSLLPLALWCKVGWSLDKDSARCYRSPSLLAEVTEGEESWNQTSTTLTLSIDPSSKACLVNSFAALERSGFSDSRNRTKFTAAYQNMTTGGHEERDKAAQKIRTSKHLRKSKTRRQQNQ